MRLVVSPVAIFPRATRKPAHNHGGRPFAKEISDARRPKLKRTMLHCAVKDIFKGNSELNALLTPFELRSKVTRTGFR